MLLRTIKHQAENLQREGYLLRWLGGFGLQTAIFVLILLSSIAILALNIQSNRIKKSTDQYMFTEARLLANSAIDFALLSIGGYDRKGGGCLESSGIDAKPYDVNITILYLFANLHNPVNCKNATESDILQSQNGTALIDVVVRSQKLLDSEVVAVQKRSVELP